MANNLDGQANLAVSAVATAPSPATSGTSLVVTSGHGARFPPVPFNATIYPSSGGANPSSAEVVRVTARSTDTLTIVRAQESSTARTVVVGDLIVAGITKLSWDNARDQHGMDARTSGADNAGTTGVTTNNAAWLTLLTAAENGRTTLPLSAGQGHAHGTKTIRIPAGVYTFTTLASFLGQEALGAQTSGLHFQGEPGATHIIFNPSSATDFMAFDYWWNVSFSGISFYAAIAGCTLFHSTANNTPQRFRFENCTFYGWKYIAFLNGVNNNSEILFLNCHNYFNNNDGAWLRIPSTSSSDQFLNYWWVACTHWSTSAPVVWADKGGHFKIYGMDVSDWGTALSATGYMFRLNGNTHASGVCNLEVHGLRVEAKSNYCAVLYSEWPQGTVMFDSFDMSSQSYSGSGYTYGDVIKVVYGNVPGPNITFKNSYLAGGVNVGWGTNAWQKQHRILFDNCEWAQKAAPDLVVTYDTSGAGGNNLTLPPVEFIRCRPDTQVDPFNGQATWDATIGWRGDLVQALAPRVLSVRGVYGTPSGSDILKFRLPIGAMITEFEAMAPAGTSGEADGGTWTLATTDGTPVTIATAVVSGAMSAGYRVNTVLTTPFDCSTSAKATLTVTCTSVSTANSKAVLFVKGYW